MKSTKYVRLFNVIIEVATKKRTVHQSINAAKRASRKIQMSANGALGRGTIAAP